MGFNKWLDKRLLSISQSKWISSCMVQYYYASCGIICGLLVLLGLVAARFVPPIKPWWTAEQTALHYQTHIKGVHGGAALMIVSGMFYLPFSAAISYQMRRVPKLPYYVHQVQLAAAAAGVWTLMLPGVILGLIGFRPYRPVEITQTLSDLFWLCSIMTWPTFMIQNFAFAHAILADNREQPLFPKELGIVNIIIPILYTPAISIHTTLYGPLAFNGGIGYWTIFVIFFTQLCIDSVYLVLAIRQESKEEFAMES
ncbi:hypothetical protein ASPZODRAFT_137396 [Penicilliopsis zonata CBS 506.65]|uniref:Uncharacterized protein n=1 Tax=Penicilliopsis zonata CBS 506.65 TaxID=1073090 RepID=A0A1L9S519_9EURO|nr:hypothetical protein ASPZODRAFT_137396 [Penicilliopsis zonata CBS 506.65]OJJ42250.1 hypothetical protein ASPZODRAFT_137396 [Penicilliopsis zonata CBS 506.65]